MSKSEKPLSYEDFTRVMKLHALAISAVTLREGMRALSKNLPGPDWPAVFALLTRIYDHIAEGRPLPEGD